MVKSELLGLVEVSHAWVACGVKFVALQSCSGSCVEL